SGFQRLPGLLFPLIPNTNIFQPKASGSVTVGGGSPADGKRLGEQMSKKIGGGVVLAAICALSIFLLNCGSSSSRPSGLLYVLTQGINGAGDNISSFAINLGSGNLSLINSNAQTCATANGCGLPLDILLDPTASVAFVLNQGSPCTPTPPCTPTGSIPPTINA